MIRKSLEQYVAMMPGVQSSYAYVLANGHEGVSKRLTKKERAIYDACAQGRNLRQKECFLNAFELLISDTTDTVQYVEGYFAFHRIPVLIEHAWIEINGKTIDPTIVHDDGSKAMGIIPEGVSYFGVPIPKIRVFARAFAMEMSGPIIDDMDNQWPLLRGEAMDKPSYKRKTRRRASTR